MLQTSVTGIIAIGMLMVIVSGNIDLSVGSLLAIAVSGMAVLNTAHGVGMTTAMIIAVAFQSLNVAELAKWRNLIVIVIAFGLFLCHRIV